MTVFAWAALGVAIVIVIATALYALATGLRAWRSFRRFRRRIVDGLGDVTRRAEGMERHLAEAGAAAARLDAANAELQESLATARVLSAALNDLRTAVRRVRGILAGASSF